MSERERLYYPHEVADFGEHELSGRQEVAIPLYYLHGRQPAEEYDRKKTLAIKKDLERYGLSYLRRYPILTCGIPTINGLQIVIIDGHHRARYSPKYGIYAVPSLIFDSAQMAKAYKIGTADFEQRLQEEVSETIRSFSQRMGQNYRLPQLVKGAFEVNDLKKIDF